MTKYKELSQEEIDEAKRNLFKSFKGAALIGSTIFCFWGLGYVCGCNDGVATVEKAIFKADPELYVEVCKKLTQAVK